MTGKHVGEAMGIPASNKDISVRGMELWQVANGKVVEHWGVVDISDVLEKAGLVPHPRSDQAVDGRELLEHVHDDLVV